MVSAFNYVVIDSRGPKDLEGTACRDRWFLFVSDFIKMIMNYFAKIDQGIFLNLNFRRFVDFDA